MSSISQESITEVQFNVQRSSIYIPYRETHIQHMRPERTNADRRRLMGDLRVVRPCGMHVAIGLHVTIGLHVICGPCVNCRL